MTPHTPPEEEQLKSSNILKNKRQNEEKKDKTFQERLADFDQNIMPRVIKSYL